MKPMVMTKRTQKIPSEAPTAMPMTTASEGDCGGGLGEVIRFHCTPLPGHVYKVIGVRLSLTWVLRQEDNIKEGGC